MAEAVEISRQERPVNFRQQSTINPENLERNFRHADDEINKIYQLLGDKGIISQASVRTVIVGGGGGGGGVATTFDALTDTPTNKTGQGGKFVKVNSGTTALEYGDESGSAFWQDPVIDILTIPPI